ncbi:MAG: hypothetical protein WCJ35_25485 [Planctomycetota bacterium]
MKCPLCDNEVDSVDQAVELGWHPDFWAEEVNYQGPVCLECCSTYFAVDEDGVLTLKPDSPLPPAAIPTAEVQSEAYVHDGQKFPLGEIVATPAALKAIEDAGQSPDFFLDRHVQGDWGEVDAFDSRANDEALTSSDRILSAYRTLKNVKIWIITEGADDDGQREATTILIPSEY